MAMYGLGILKGLGVTIRHFVSTYVEDVKVAARRATGNEFQARQGLDAKGLYTVQYPEEKLAVPERFRFIPFLVVEDLDHPERPGEDWCTSCGICAKVCPPQCIWIVRGEDPVTKRPIPQPEAFFIDIDICMNCGYCAEFCPFDAIKMDHDYEMATYDRTEHHIFDKPKLSKPFSYWLSIAPTTVLEETRDRGGWEHTDVIKSLRKQGETATPYTEPYPSAKMRFAGEATATATAAPVATAVTVGEDPEVARIRRRKEALTRKLELERQAQ